MKSFDEFCLGYQECNTCPLYPLPLRGELDLCEKMYKLLLANNGKIAIDISEKMESEE